MPVAVRSIVPRAGPEPVFNLEVLGNHTYHVGSSPILVHNGGLLSWVCKNASPEPKQLKTELHLPKGDQRAILNERMAQAGQLKKSGQITHHVIPLEAINQHQSLMEKAARGGFDINGANNGFHLNTEYHIGGHKRYNKAVLNELAMIEQQVAKQNLSDADAAALVQGAGDKLKKAMNDGTFFPDF